MFELIKRPFAAFAGTPLRSDSPNLPRPELGADSLPDLMIKKSLGGDSHHAYQKISHALAVVCIILAVLLAFDIIAFLLYALNKQTEVVMLQWATGTDRWVRIVQLPHDSAGMQNYLEKTATSYVVLRESILPDKTEMERRWGDQGDVWLLSSNDVWNAFHSSDAYQALEKSLIENGGSRVIQDNKISTIALGPNQFRAEYTTLTRQYADAPPVEQKWVSIVTLVNTNRTIRETQRLANPFGTTVVNYGRSQS